MTDIDVIALLALIPAAIATACLLYKSPRARELAKDILRVIQIGF